MKPKQTLVETIEIETENYEEDCKKCNYNHSFLCSKFTRDNVVEGLYKSYDLVLDIYENSDPFKIHDIEINLHREGKYHTIVVSNHHCGEYFDCNCDKFRCDKVDKIQARKIPQCYKNLSLKIPEKYKNGDFIFLIRDR